MFTTHRSTVTLQLHNFDLFRTCRTSSFCTNHEYLRILTKLMSRKKQYGPRGVGWLRGIVVNGVRRMN